MKCVLMFFLLASFSASAVIEGSVKIYGKVVSYDAKSAVLSRNNGKKIKIPRDSIFKDFKKLKTGYCVQSELNIKQWEKILDQKLKENQAKP